MTLRETVPCAAGLDQGTFAKTYLAQGLPVILIDQVPQWPAFGLWDRNWFVRNSGERLVRAVVNSRGGLTPTEQEWVSMSFAEFFDMCDANESSPQHVAVQSIFTGQRWLMPDFKYPTVVAGQTVEQAGLWLAPQGTTTHLHWDHRPGFQSVVRGCKEFILFPPDQLDAMYPFPFEAARPALANWSRVDFTKPDLERFPAYDAALGYRVRVDGGQMLHLPMFWWHAVRNVGDLTIAVNFFITPPWQPPAYAMEYPFYRERVSAGASS